MNVVTLQQWLLFEADVALYLAAGLSFSIVSGFLSWCLLVTRSFKPMNDGHQDVVLPSPAHGLNLHDASVTLTQVQLLGEDAKETFASYTITLTWGSKLDSHSKLLRKRYSEFAALAVAIKTEAKDRAAVPALPSKSLIRLLNPAYLEKRRQGLELFMHQVASNPKLANLPSVRQFCALP
ncbi:hypothetical protein ACHHYP_08576 [Achlya hypogyna]|uniref:PX domain-containing protein n=1 Tax=Achlya hypogyna TaxID=1202772 RepID=A0A1V9ZKB8_ACHHY|nr:hypothetical protein ACHHYP_08576 [Achlya hypogyna]